MTNEKKIFDQLHLQKYIFIINLFLEKKIDLNLFEKIFLTLRREDNYWMSNSFSETIGNILDSIFLDVDECNPEGLFNPNDEFNISETELRNRLRDKLIQLEE